MGDELSTFKMYEQLLEQSALDSAIDSSLKSFTNKWVDESDAEVFITSKEVVKSKEQAEGRRELEFDEKPETIHFKRYGTKRVHKYTDSEMEVIRSSCHNSIVHDYGTYDWYHVSDEERNRHDELAELSLRLAKLKRTYRRVDQYIEAMRTVYEAWEILSHMNFVHTRKEFFKMVAEGHIVSNRIIMPKLKRIDQYNLDMIIGYISNPTMDVSHLAPTQVSDSFFNEESDEEEMLRLLSPEEIQYICEYDDNPEKLEVEPFKDKYISGYADRKLKRRKREGKDEYELRKSISQILKKVESNSHFKEFGRSYMLTHSIFEPSKKEDDFWDDMRFDGSWASNSDMFVYDLAINEKMMDTIPPNERYLTYGDKELEKFFRTLEENDVSTIELRRRMSTSAIDKIKAREVKRESRKIEASIMQRIRKLNTSAKFKKIAAKAEEALTKYKYSET